LPALCCRFFAAERREVAFAFGADRILFFLIEGTIYFRRELNRPSALNIGAAAVSPIRP
jgi:hypothetical protein